MAKNSTKLTPLQQEYNKELRRVKRFVKSIEKRGYFFEGKQKEEIEKLLNRSYISSKHKEKISSKTIEALKNKKPDWFYKKAKYIDIDTTKKDRFGDYKRVKVSGLEGRFIERKEATAKAIDTKRLIKQVGKDEWTLSPEAEKGLREFEKRFNEQRETRNELRELEREAEDEYNRQKRLDEIEKQSYDFYSRHPELEEEEERTEEPVQIDTEVNFDKANLKLVDGQFLVNKSTGEVVDVSPDLKIVDGKFIVNTETGEVLGEASQDGQYIYDKKNHQLIGKTTDYSSPESLPPINEADAIIDNLESLIDNWTPPANWKHGTYMAKQEHINTLRNILNGAIQRDGKQTVARRISERFGELEQHINTAMYVPYMEKVQEALVAINYIILGRSPDVLESQEFDEEMGEDWEDYE